MNEPLPFKDPPQLMEQTLNLAPTTTTTSFDQNVADYKQGRTQMRQAVLREYEATKKDPKRKMTDYAKAVGDPIETVRSVLKEALAACVEKSGVATPVFSEELSEAFPTQTAIREFSRLPAEDRQAITAASNISTKAQQLLAAARERKAAADQKWQLSDPAKESDAEKIAERRAKGRESLIQKGFKEITYNLSLILQSMPEAESQEQVKAELRRLANQLADVGIYPDKPHDE
ncbi:hypothetical protein SynBIOSU31_02082 [Synechococcus sp. BIOS-U3-1]|uniref:hypothetical protein n=1 Tax=Synechococcus sp. BIOS-U3-1 TaxID=1400865 RepID=UPI0016451357|nr:hypothetical protein [Synechococcus sp. BIOS-U3-1]QNI58948.1 hypothetical protein SynBIOSU31_02082 [Synechococcus sp. BIOS-U3-1]